MTDSTDLPQLPAHWPRAVRDAFWTAVNAPTYDESAAATLAFAQLVTAAPEPPADRAALREAARLVAEYTGNEIDANAQMLLRLADGTPRPDDPQPASLPPGTADRAAELAAADRQFLRFALDLAQEQMFSRSNEFDSADEAALARLRRMADEAQPASPAPLASGLPLVQGRCPACGGASLFLGDGGYVTCSRIDCPEPDAASTLLERPAAGARQDGAQQ